jgi:rhomboid protease GluP
VDREKFQALDPMNLIRRLREAPVAVGLIAVNLLVYAVMLAVSPHLVSFDDATLIGAGACVSRANLDVSHWRWLTAAFVHVGIAHVFMNLWVLAQIGVISERAIGRGLFVATYVATGVLGNVLSTFLGAHSVVPRISAGASGAIMGLIGAATVFAWSTGQRALARSLAFNILLVLGVGLTLTARGIASIDNAAHVGGLVAGAAVGFGRVRLPGPAPRWLDATLIAAGVVLTAIAFAVVLVTGA